MASPKGLSGAGLGAIGVAVVAVGLLVWDYFRKAEPAAVADVAPAAPQPAGEAAPKPAEPTGEAAESAPEVPADAPPVIDPAALIPTFDLPRIEPDGSALVAGRAPAKAQVEVLVDNAPVAQSPATDAGEFVAMFTLPPSDTPRLMTLRATLADGTVVLSKDSFAIAPTPAAEVAAADTTGVMVTEEGVAVVGGEIGAGQVTLDAVTYGASNVTLSGKGTAGESLRLYLDTALKTETLVTAAGTWSVGLPLVAGDYTLRLDQLDSTGKVTARVEQALSILPPEVVTAEAPAEEPAQPAAETVAEAPAETPAETAPEPAPPEPPKPVTITVQKGFSLWKIARENLGDGVLYVQVYEANKELIRNPDLIYPGQVLTLPAAP